MSTMIECLPCKCLNIRNYVLMQLISEVAGEAITPDIEFIEDSDECFEDNYLDLDNSTDSDDEVEEANQYDDIFG
jgi:hypothetical protein